MGFKKTQLNQRCICLFLCLCVLVSGSGCTTLKPNEYEEFGYKGTPVVKEGIRIAPIDWLGNLFGIFDKLIIWNWRIKRHNISPATKQAVQDYLEVNGDVLGNVAVQLNRYAPQDEWRRLVTNKGVYWLNRLIFGTLTVLVFDTLLIDRIFGGDRYNPYTHTVHIHSDLPSIALHELGHARDYSEKRYRGSYALFRFVPFGTQYEEYRASEMAFDYLWQNELTDIEQEAYRVLYPALGTYMDSCFVTGVYFALLGHLWGHYDANSESEMALFNP